MPPGAPPSACPPLVGARGPNASYETVVDCEEEVGTVFHYSKIENSV